MQIITDLAHIELDACEKQEENEDFISCLKQQSSSSVDQIVSRLNSEITPQIDCTRCGNCCKTLMIQVEKNEIDAVADKLNLTGKEFTDKFIETGIGERMLMNSIPCVFLSDTKCSVYNERFSSCKEFPGLHLPQFTARLFTVFMHYGRCPIIYNVIEGLKINLHFNEAYFQQS